VCNNFKDRGVQCYGGAMFREVQEAVEAAFLRLPPPTPSIKPDAADYRAAAGGGGGGGARGHAGGRLGHVARGGSRGGHGGGRATLTSAAPSLGGSSPRSALRAGGASPPAPAASFIDRYYNHAGGCFHPDGRVAMADGSAKRVGDVAAGDVVAGGAVVVCVQVLPCSGGVMDLVRVGGKKGVLLTPWHPVRIGGVWRFPAELAPAVPCAVHEVIDFVLSAGHTVTINGVECVTLGHDFTDPVVSHPYFGSRAVVADLARMPGWREGRVVLSHSAIERDPRTHAVVGLRPTTDGTTPRVAGDGMGGAALVSLCVV
jgi:hypothetical protein